MSDTPQWQWDASRHMQYYFCPTENAYIFQNGLRVPLGQGSTATASSSASTSASRNPASPRSGTKAAHTAVAPPPKDESSDEEDDEEDTEVPDQSGPYSSWSSPAAATDLAAQTAQLNIRSSEYTTGATNLSEIQPQYTAEQLQNVSVGYGGLATGNVVVPEQPDDIHQALQQRGIQMGGRIRGYDPQSPLDPGYRVRTHGDRFFKIGKVIKVVWPELQGGFSGSTSTDNRFVRNGIFTKIRWFIIVQEGYHFSLCLPINTYNRRGVAKPGVVKGQHAIAYSSSKEPNPQADELPRHGEEGMMPGIRILPHKKTDKLDPMARIDFGRVYTVEHNVKVYDLGNVHPDHAQRLLFQWTRVIQGGGVGTGSGGLGMPNIPEDSALDSDDDDDEDDEEEDESEEESAEEIRRRERQQKKKRSDSSSKKKNKKKKFPFF